MCAGIFSVCCDRQCLFVISFVFCPSLYFGSIGLCVNWDNNFVKTHNDSTKVTFCGYASRMSEQALMSQPLHTIAPGMSCQKKKKKPQTKWTHTESYETQTTTTTAKKFNRFIFGNATKNGTVQDK